MGTMTNAPAFLRANEEGMGTARYPCRPQMESAIAAYNEIERP